MPQRLADMIFAPGFSTASELSQLAGRGVGMDVVKTEVSRLGGRIEVDFHAGRGHRVPPLPPAHAGRHPGAAGARREPELCDSVGHDRAGARSQGGGPEPYS